MDEKIVHAPCVTMWIEDGILYGEYAKDAEIDLPIAEQIVAARLKLSGDKSYPCLADISGIKSVSKEARVYMAKEGTLQMIALALITGNIFTRTLAHIFTIINKPPVATHYFGSKEAARDWLIQFVRDKKKLDALML
jgi:hypothetical protein